MFEKFKNLWSNYQERKERKIIEQFNSKVSRETIAHPENAKILPKQIMTDAFLKKYIENENGIPLTKQDKKIDLKLLTKFVRDRNAAKIASTNASGEGVTKWELERLQKLTKQVNKERKKEREFVNNLDVTSRGKDVGIKRGVLEPVTKINLQDKKFNPKKIHSGKEWQKFSESVTRQSRKNYRRSSDETFRDNYIQALYNSNLGDAEQIEKLVRSVSISEFKSIAAGDEQAKIKFFYDPINSDDIGNILLDIWQKAANASGEDNEDDG